MKSVLILGATSDVGKALAHEYAGNGYELYLGGRNTEDISPICNDLKIKHEVSATAYTFDAMKVETHDQLISSLPSFPDVVICVFGYLGDQEKAQENWDVANQIIETNYTGAASILERFAKSMEQNKSGSIVGISSVAGERGRQSNYFYGSAKAGFTAYLSGLRNRLFHSNVNVLTVKPGFIDTKMTEGMDLPKPLTASPQQVAKAIYKAERKGKATIYVLGMWRLIMYIIKSIPEFIFKRLKL
ncbi:SDR family oxidoreductase [Fulvivirga sp. RKSG066]|uniref:SDR family oxidoreductase n=1 Tax=Fulvivirga aurantia TaxID=2529383 RepID=UPI0012BB8FBD|nr:SDR family oxidoreductase [Fulvivirga aurantia]MTI20659.1 SDR family oxidoreductase [Fulvivirga aurantia]